MFAEGSPQFIAAFMSDSLAKMPLPTPMTEQRACVIRKQCKQLDESIAEMQALYGHVPPDRWQDIHKRYVMARISRDLIYFQLFRINDLPLEIISIIIREVVWAGGSSDVGIRTRIRLTSVCKRWREVAIGDATLWKSVWFRDKPPHARAFCWFDRAGATAIDIRVSEPHEGLWTGPQMEALFDKVLLKGSQIRSIVVTVNNWPPALVVLDRVSEYCQQRSMPLLERFELHRSGSPYVWIGAGYEPDKHRIPMTLFGGVQLPSVEHVTINGIHIDWNLSPLSNLTRLDIRRIPLELSPSLDRFREILRLCPRLSKLSLDGAGPSWKPISPDDEPVVLPNLSHLVVGDYSLQYALYVLQQFKAPNIRELSLMNLVGEDYAPFYSMITGSFPEVRVLTLFNIECTGTSSCSLAMIKWLMSMPKLGFLRIAGLRQHVINLFLYDCAGLPLGPTTSQDKVPKEERRRIHVAPQLKYVDVVANDPQLVVSLVLTRRAIGLPLKKVFIDRGLSLKFSNEQSAHLLSASEIYIMPAPVQTDEELDLLES
ncbi:hypothetical protein ONZ45_g180 [Pleurotus djamor]|nr:hypothetical protein ONZ45_g180 [Pleurotus djamor]